MVIKKEKRKPPTDPPCPELKRKEQPVLVERTKQRQKFEAKGSAHEEEIRTTYMEAAKEGAAKGARAVVDVPAMDTLKGKRVEFKWDPPWSWCAGVVQRIAGKHDKKSNRKNAAALEFDWAYIKYDGEKTPRWCQLRAGWFCKDKRGAWRLL